jgi:hypothetical protein
MSADRPERSRTFRGRVRTWAAVVTGALLGSTALVLSPPANAMLFGNYNLQIPDRFDFHTWIFFVGPCGPTSPYPADCLRVSAHSQPIAKAYAFNESAQLVDGRWVLTVDDPFGLRCGNVYYGPTVQTHDVYSWDANTLAGTLVSTFAAGCDGQPGSLTYPISLTRM